MKYAIILCCSLAVACTTPRDIEIERESDKLVLLGEVNADSVVEVNLLYSKFITDPWKYDYHVKNAEIGLFEDGRLVEYLQEMPEPPDYDPQYFTTYRSVSDFQPSEGKKYRIEISADGFQTIEAESIVPTKTVIDSMRFTPTQVPISTNYSAHPVSIWFENDTEEEDFYRLELYRRYFRAVNSATEDEYHEESIENLKILSAQSQTQDIGGGDPFDWIIYFSDIHLAGEHLQRFDFYTRLWDGSPIVFGKENSSDTESSNVSLVVRLRHITKQHFEYGQTAQLQLSSADDPFSEPVIIQTNVENGLGIFGIYSQTIKETF